MLALSPKFGPRYLASLIKYPKYNFPLGFEFVMKSSYILVGKLVQHNIFYVLGYMHHNAVVRYILNFVTGTVYTDNTLE